VQQPEQPTKTNDPTHVGGPDPDQVLPEPEDDTLDSDLAALRAEVEAANQEVLRIRAETENQRKRLLRDTENARKYAIERVLQDLLPTVDALERGIESADLTTATVATLKEGTAMSLAMLIKALEHHGMKQLAPLGEPFNPDFHQAVSMAAQPGVSANTVIAVMQRGYTLNERLIRPALVTVAS
jgi:molecular chaperone GrpE